MLVEQLTVVKFCATVCYNIPKAVIYMKRILAVLIVVIMIFSFSSCANVKVISPFTDKDIEQADARMEQLFDEIKQQNKDGLKELFSEKAIDDTENINIEIDDFLSFVQGKVVSWSRDESPIVFDSVENGNKTKQLVTWYTLDTDEQSYLILLVDYPIDTINSENAGLYSIRILKAEDENKLVGTWEDWVIPGIYILDN